MNFNWGLAKKKGLKPVNSLGKRGCKPMGPPSRPAPKRKSASSRSSTTVWGKSQHTVLNTSAGRSGTGTGSSELEAECKTLIAITECRGDIRSEVGIAFIDLSLPAITLCQMADSQSYINTLTKINILNPSEIIVPATFVDNPNDRLTKFIKMQFPRARVVSIPRRFFNKANGMDSISQLCLPTRKAICVGLRYKYYALAAAAALLHHLQNNFFIFYGNETLDVVYEECEGHAIIDVSTADRLELVSSTKPLQASKYSTLFGVLNYCYTRIGVKCLRTSILQPPCVPEIIENRSHCVAELLKYPEFHTSLQATLQKISSIGQLLNITTVSFGTSNSFSPKQLNYLLLVNNLIDLVEPVKDVLKNFRQPFFKQVVETLESENFLQIAELIRKTVNPCAQLSTSEDDTMQRCFAIKTGLNDLLDLMRRAYSERMKDMSDYVKNLGEKYNLPLTLGNNKTKGFHIVLRLTKQQKRLMHASELPSEFISVQRLAGSFTMKTLEIINFSSRLDDIMIDVLRLSNLMIQETIIELKQYIPFFYKLCEDIANLDMLQSLAEASRRGNYVKPSFGEFTEIAKARHPMLELLSEENVVANQISFDTRHNVQIITGPNGSGKSIYIRQVMLLQIMAQIGSYIPAESAVIRPIDRMFARVYLEDNFECGASTFTFEMEEIKYMLTLVTDRSLFIVDEICRSTSVDEGVALAMAICEKFCHTSAFLFVTTHYTTLTKLRDMYLNVVTWQMETQATGEEPQDLILSHRYNLIPGVTQLKHYGVYLVRNIWPDCIRADVYNILRQLKRDPKELNIVKVDERIRLKYELETNVLKLKSQNKLDEASLNKHLNHYISELEKFGIVLRKNDGVLESSSYRNLQNDDDISESSSYRNVSFFLQQDSDNINKLIPEISIHSSDRSLVVPGDNSDQSFERNNDSGNIFQQNRSFVVVDNDSNQISQRNQSSDRSFVVVDNNSIQRNQSSDSFGTPPSPPKTQVQEEIVQNQRFDSFGTEPTPPESEAEFETPRQCNYHQVEHETSSREKIFDSFGPPPSPLQTQVQREIEMEMCEPTPPQTQENVSANKDQSSSMNWGDNEIDDNDLNSIMDELECLSDVFFSADEETGRINVEDANKLSSPSSVEGSINYSPLQSPAPSQTENSKSSSSLNFGAQKIILEDTSKQENSKSSTSNESKKPLKRKIQKRFVPPRKLTKREIEEEFHEQDRAFYETSVTNPESSKDLMQKMLNRPSVKQVQQSKHLAFVRRTDSGVQVLPIQDTNKKKNFKFTRKLSNNSSSNVDVTIFSDANAKTFEQFINSKEGNVKNFDFKKSRKDSEANQFDVQLSANNINKSFTPEGFYKENKQCVDTIVAKYLPPSCESNRVQSTDNSIFETCSSVGDFDLS